MKMNCDIEKKNICNCEFRTNKQEPFRISWMQLWIVNGNWLTIYKTSPHSLKHEINILSEIFQTC